MARRTKTWREGLLQNLCHHGVVYSSKSQWLLVLRYFYGQWRNQASDAEKKIQRNKPIFASWWYDSGTGVWRTKFSQAFQFPTPPPSCFDCCFEIKPIKHKIKVWRAADASNGYVVNFSVYIGRDREIQRRQWLGYNVFRDSSSVFQNTSCFLQQLLFKPCSFTTFAHPGNIRLIHNKMHPQRSAAMCLE